MYVCWGLTLLLFAERCFVRRSNVGWTAQPCELTSSFGAISLQWCVLSYLFSPLVTPFCSSLHLFFHLSPRFLHSPLPTSLAFNCCTFVRLFGSIYFYLVSPPPKLLSPLHPAPSSSLLPLCRHLYSSLTFKVPFLSTVLLPSFFTSHTLFTSCFASLCIFRSSPRSFVPSCLSSYHHILFLLTCCLLIRCLDEKATT